MAILNPWGFKTIDLNSSAETPVFNFRASTHVRPGNQLTVRYDDSNAVENTVQVYKPTENMIAIENVYAGTGVDTTYFPEDTVICKIFSSGDIVAALLLYGDVIPGAPYASPGNSLSGARGTLMEVSWDDNYDDGTIVGICVADEEVIAPGELIRFPIRIL